jgi:hypothetical protein
MAECAAASGARARFNPRFGATRGANLKLEKDAAAHHALKTFLGPNDAARLTAR